MVRSVFKLILAFGLIAAGALMVLSGVQGASGAAPVKVSPTGPVTVSATTAAMPSAGVQVVGYGTDKDTYSRGDTAKGYIELKNTGNSAIKRRHYPGSGVQERAGAGDSVPGNEGFQAHRAGP